MEEHKENKCAMVKVDDTIDITTYGQNQRPGLFFAQQAVLPPDNYPFFQSSPSFPHQPPFQSFLFGHTQMPHPPVYTDPPPAYEHHKKESLRVDLQWLASVADVCGEENLDQVLAQNMMVQGSYSAAASRPQVHGHGSASGDPDTHTSKLEFESNSMC